MSVFFLSLTVSAAFGLWELCSSKYSDHALINHPSKGLRCQKESPVAETEGAPNQLALADA